MILTVFVLLPGIINVVNQVLFLNYLQQILAIEFNVTNNSLSDSRNQDGIKRKKNSRLT